MTLAIASTKSERRTVLVVGAGFSGLLVARDLAKHFDVTIIDAKEYFEYTPGILRAYVKPEHLDHLTFRLQPVVEKKMGCRFIWGEVKMLDAPLNRAVIRPMFVNKDEEISFDYCCISSGCNFNFLHTYGESLWFPSVHQITRDNSSWKHIDERFLEGRRRHILDEHAKLKNLENANASVLVCGAGFIGVEWATELKYFFPKLQITIIDFLPNCLGPLPESAQKYCDAYLKKVGITAFYNVKYEPKDRGFWNKIGLPNGAAEVYVCMGVKASNYFMPKETLSDKGPGGGNWIYINKFLQVTKGGANGEGVGNLWGKGNVFAIGDCNYGNTGGPDDWKVNKGMPPIPKISYPAEEQGAHVVRSIKALDYATFGRPSNASCFCWPTALYETWWPWGAGMFATSLGPKDACFVIAANEKPKSGYMMLRGTLSVWLKDFVETSKIDECKEGFLGGWIWHFVHHTPVHLFGRGRFK